MQTQSEPVPRYRVALALPGTSFHFGCMHAAVAAGTSPEHDIFHLHANDSADNFNSAWATALNMYEAGGITHFAMLHADIWPRIELGKRDWLSVLIAELERLKGSLISVAVPIKDHRGVFSCGIGNPDNNWHPLRRITSREFMKLPETIGAADYGYQDGMLLHNNGMWVCDLRYKEFFAQDADGNFRCFFDYPKKLRRDPKSGMIKVYGESEDWYFSRQLHELGLRNTYITRKIALDHAGMVFYPNDDRGGKDGWGTYHNGDEDSAFAWRTNGKDHARENQNSPQHRRERRELSAASPNA